MAREKFAKEHWFAVMLYVVFSVFFLVAGVMSASTYSRVTVAQQEIVLVSPTGNVEVLSNGSLYITFSIELSNPSEFALDITAATWYVKVFNTTDQAGPLGGVPWIQIARDLTPTGIEMEVDANTEMTFSYEATVSDPSILSRLEGFFDWCSANGGDDYTLATAPYHYEFFLTAWIGDFEREYLREMYLNNLVKIEVSYISWETE